MFHFFRASRIPSLALTAAAYVALFVSIRAWAYGHPVFLNFDFTVTENMFRDIVRGAGSLGQWYLPRPSYYQDILLYFGLRFLGGDVHQGLALFAAAQICLLAAGAHFVLAWLARQAWQARNNAWLALPVALSLRLAVEDGTGTWLMGSLAHVMTLAMVVWAAGLLLRRMAGGGLWPLLLLTALSTLCDFLFVLYSVLPGLALLGLRAWLSRPEARSSLRDGALIALAVIVGRVADLLTRAYPPARLGSLRPHVLPEYLLQFAQDCLNAAAQTPYVAACWLVGFCALAWWGWRGSAPLRHLAWWGLGAMLINVLIIAMHAMQATYYYMIFLYLPLLIGLPLFLARWGGRRIPVTVLSCAGLGILVWCAATDVAARRDPLYPPQARCLDRLAETHPDISMLTHYSLSQHRFFTRQADVRVGHIFSNMFPYHLNSNPSTRPETYNAVLFVPGEDPWGMLEPDLLRRAAGEPEEIFVCTETGNNTQFWLYPGGVRALTPGDALFEGERLAPEFARDDQTLWNGAHRFADGLTLVRVTTAERWDERWCILEFAATAKELEGKTFRLSFAGNKSPRHRRFAAHRLSAAPDGSLAEIWRLLLHRHDITARADSIRELPGGHAAVYFPVSSRHSTAWPVYELEWEKERLALTPPAD